MAVDALTTSERKKWLVIDTDAGVDDAFAIAMALKTAHQYGYEIRAITTVFGNCSLDQVIKNVSKVRAACGMDLHTGPRIYRGCDDPIIKEFKMDAAYFHGKDGLGNNDFVDEDSGVLDDGNDAAGQLITICREAKQCNAAVTLLTLGPLTNLAAAIKMDDNLVLSIDSLVIIGGCGNGHGNVRRTAEFNVAADPEAAAIVFDNLAAKSKICTVVSWELTLATPIPWEVFDELNSTESAKRSRLNRFLREISTFSYCPGKREPIPHFSIPGEHFNGAVVCDALAMAVALNPEAMIRSSHTVNAEVELCGTLTRGQTVVDWGCYDGIIRPKNCNWVMEANNEAYIEMFKAIYDR